MKDSWQAAGKVPAHARDAEEAVLGALLLERDRLDEVMVLLNSAEYFYVPSHQMIYEAILHLSAAGSNIDLITVAEHLSATGKLDKVGGPFYLTKLTEGVVSSAHVVSHSAIIKEKYLKRKMVSLANEMIAMGMDNSDVFENMDAIDRSLAEFNMQLSGSEPVPLVQAMPDALSDLVRLRDLQTEFTGIPTGNPYLDELTGGWQDGNLIVLGARPGTGKTMLGLGFAIAAAKDNIPVGFFTMEMSVAEITKRLICSLTHTSNNKIKAPKRFTDDEFGNMLQQSEKYMKLPIHVDGESGLSLATLKSKIRKLVSRKGVKMVVIDYLQLMSIPGFNTNKELGDITRGLKTLAKQLQVPIVLLSQLSRDSAKGGRIPKEYDLRDSGSIESDADIIMLLYKAIDAQLKESPALKHAVMVNIEKNRNGAKEEALPIWPEWDKFIFHSEPLGAWHTAPAPPTTNNIPSSPNMGDFDNAKPF